MGLSGCYDFPNVENVDVDPFTSKFVFPVMNSKITFAELAGKTGANSVIEEYPGSDLYFISFRDSVDLGVASDLFPISSVSFPNKTLDFGAALTPGFTSYGPITLPYNETYTAIPGGEIKRVDFSGGTIHISISNTYKHRIDGNISLTSLKNSQGDSYPPITFTIQNGGLPFITDIDLNGYYLDLLDPPSTYNNIKYSITASITSSGDPSLVGSLAIDIALNNPAYQKITGMLTSSFNLSNQEYNIGIFGSTVFAEQHFADPRFTLKFVNSFGLPASANFTSFEVENNNGDKVSVAHEGPNNPDDLLIGTPNEIKYATNLTPIDTTTLKLTATNSNVENLFDIAPKIMRFSGASIDIGDNLSHDYFVTGNSKLQLFSDIEIPLSGWVVTNEIADTLKNMDWPDLEKDFKMTDAYVRLKFKFTNGIPINLLLQVKFLDVNGALVTELFDGGETKLIQSSEVDPVTGETTTPKEAYTYITLDKAKYDQIKLSKDMVFVIRFTTGGNSHQNIKILSSNSLALQMQLEVNGTVDL